MIDISYNGLKEYFKSLNYHFDERVHGLNIIGIRSSLNATNLWDDKLVLAYINNKREPIVKVFNEFTTDPGYYFLKTKLLNPKGCAILCEGQHLKMFTVGKHNNKYEALVQYTPVTVYRDSNKDNILDTTLTDKGMFGINLHHGYNSSIIFNNSAGCQVLKNIKDLSEVLALAKLHEAVYKKGINYTLLR